MPDVKLLEKSNVMPVNAKGSIPPFTRSVAEMMLEQLALWGVKRIYGVVGDAIFGLMDAFAKQKQVAFIAVKHESVAALMASAEAKYTGGLGVCVAQIGPGLANLINGLGDAYLDGYPVLAITGEAPLSKIGTAYKQRIDQHQLMQPISAYSELAVHPDAVFEVLSTAVRTSRMMGTVSHLSVPADVFAMPASGQPLPFSPIVHGTMSADQLQQALQTMRLARRPFLLIGESARGLAYDIQQLAVTWGCGIAAGYGAVGIVPDSFPLMLGGLGEGGNPELSNLFRQADVVVSLGTTWWPEGETPSNARVIQIQPFEALLGHGMPMEMGIVGEMAQIVPSLLAGLASYETHPDWGQAIEQCKQKWVVRKEEESSGTAFPLHPAHIVRTIEKVIPPDAVIALDEGDSTLWFLRHFHARQERVLLSHHWRTMGFGLPAAMAAKCSAPHQQVICLTGDGGLAMVLADMLTAARYQWPITLIVCNNGTLQMERGKMSAKGLIPEGTELVNPDYVKLAEACGWEAIRPASVDEFEQVLRTVMTARATSKHDSRSPHPVDPVHSENPALPTHSAYTPAPLKPILIDIATARVPFPNYPTE